ncbi:MAG: diguanylate cyclase (GGDEF)-like protein [Paraglaciecola sp.]|jgi:diguanylate cyclase (GGDEF)-like protein
MSENKGSRVMKEDQQHLEIEHKYLKIVSQYTMDILLANSEQELIEILSDTLLNKLNIDDLELYSFNPKNKTLAMTAAFTEKQSILLDLFVIPEITLGEGLIGKTAKSLVAQSIEDLRLNADAEQNKPHNLSAFIVPIVTDGKLIGVIYCASKMIAAFTSQLQKSLNTISSITAIKMEKNLAITQLQQTIEKLEYSGKIQDTLFEIAELIFETSNMQEFYQRLHKCIAKLMFASNFFVGLVIDNGQAITLPYAVDEVDEVPPNEVIPLDNEKPSITGYVLNTNKPLLASKQKIQSMINANQLYVKGSLPNAWLGVPFGKSPLRGVVVVQSYTENIGFTQKDEQLLCFVARHIRNAIERMQARADLQFLALHDPLTKLANRSLFNDRVNHALNKCRRHKNKKIALLFLDLDKFKQINDTYGHHIGDLLLIEVAKLIQTCIRETDTLSRLGGDEFGILLEDIVSAELAQRVANKIVKALQTPFMLDKIQINTSTSIGIAFNDQPDNTIDSLIICADEAMYQAKQRGRNRSILHQGEEQSGMIATKIIEQDALKGLIENQFFFIFQPIVDLKTGYMVAAEALVRWNNSKMGILPPDAFLNEMEENGSVVQLDVYNINQAVEHLKNWECYLPTHFRLAVNISALGFASSALLEVTYSLFEKNPQLFRYLTLETTEKSIVKGVELTRAQMKIFSKMGIHLALDDYGTGYSSLSYLGQFKFNHIKIDRSFISGHDKSTEQSIILETINNLAKSLAIHTVAEGIETQQQLELMQDLQCSMGQGFYISKALSNDELLALLKNQKKLIVA